MIQFCRFYNSIKECTMNINENKTFNAAISPEAVTETPQHCTRGPVNSPHGPVSSGADRPQRRVSVRDVPRRLLDLESVKARSDCGVLHWRLHVAAAVSVLGADFTAMQRL